ncbi:hypothetical protein MRX96_054220 [Rhipicephalus microplus]
MTTNTKSKRKSKSLLTDLGLRLPSPGTPVQREPRLLNNCWRSRPSLQSAAAFNSKHKRLTRLLPTTSCLPSPRRRGCQHTRRSSHRPNRGHGHHRGLVKASTRTGRRAYSGARHVLPCAEHSGDFASPRNTSPNLPQFRRQHGNLTKGSHRYCQCSGTVEEEAASSELAAEATTHLLRRTQQRPLQHRSLNALPSPYRARDQALPTSRETASRVISKAAQRRARVLQAMAVVTDPAVVGAALYRPSAPGCSFRGVSRPRARGGASWAARCRGAANVVSLECLHEPLTIAELNGISVTTREPADPRVSTGFVYGHLTDTELLRGIVSAIPVSVETMEGGTVKLHFSSLSPPNRTTIFGLQLRVRPVRPRPRHCRLCSHFGHVTETRQRPSDFVLCGRRHLEANFCKPHCVNGGGAYFATNTTCPMWQEERRVATLMAITPTLLSRRAVRPVVHEERREV